MSQVKMILNLSTLLDVGGKESPVSKAVAKELEKQNVMVLPFTDKSPFDMRWMSDLNGPMNAFISSLGTANNTGKRFIIATDFFTPLMHIIGTHLRHDGPTSATMKFDDDTPYIVKSVAIDYDLQQYNIQTTAHLLAQFFGQYRLPLFMWRKTRNLLLWPNLWSSRQLHYSTICTASRAVCGHSTLAPILHAQNFIVSNFMGIYNYMRNMCLAIAVPDERIPLSNLCTIDNTWMSMKPDQILWRCLCQLVGTYCPTHELTMDNWWYDRCDLVEDPDDIRADIIVNDILGEV